MSKIFAHRGFSGKYPENTMLAFQKAVEIGVDGIELDVHLTKDNEIVIIHDEDIKRTCDGEGLVKDMTLEELRKFDASATFRGVYGFCGIPTLREYFELVKDTPIITNIELKTGVYEYPTIEKRVIDMVREYGLSDKIIFSSFNHFTVKRCEEIAPEIKRGFLTGDWIYDFGKYTAERNVQCCHPWHVSLSEEVIKEMHEAGCEINTWTVNEYADIEKLSKWGVDSLIGNFPDRMIEVLR
ncbi:MAG: glycerophosphodiester phosphodiesterase [Clostridia bacterium]|nr:glycerophosphodiester phosphodiesterase [Clostridia bacterium]